MGTEGKGYSDMFRNTSEEMFLKTVMDSSLGMSSPTMEMLGFKNFSQNFRVDSEELFKTWLTNGEVSNLKKFESSSNRILQMISCFF